MKRKITYHAGPTNSGKTYNALVALKEAWSGVYCGPLRLLALEVYDSLNLDGTPCSLLTDQERRQAPFAGHVSCTVEMLGVEERVDCAVIDEIQLIGDEFRGASWTRAVLGVPAAHVHLCGDPSAVPVVAALFRRSLSIPMQSIDRSVIDSALEIPLVDWSGGSRR
jgi:ATP-dependent RNA helicase SUPV3L1/SUV3